MRRAADWLIGAVAMLLLLVVAAVAFLWTVSDPAARDRPTTGAGPSAGADLRLPPGEGPPPDLGEGEAWYSGVTVAAETLVTEGSTLRDVQAVGEDVVTRPGGLVAGDVLVEATVPFEVVQAQLGDGTELRAAGDGQAVVVRTVEVMGRELRVVATGTVEAQGRAVVVVPRSIDLGGPDLLADALADAVRRLVTISHEVQGLPEGFALEDVTVQEDGFRARLRGEDIRLLP